MCSFKSAIVLKNGDLLHLDGVDSHEDVLSYFKIKDNGNDSFCRVEFVPGEDLCDLDQYKFEIDQERPDWFTESLEKKSVSRLKVIVNKYVVREDRDVLPVGFYILGNVVIKNAGYATIENAGHATIKDAGDATIKDAGDATIKNAGDATIEYAGYATIENAGYAAIENAGYATIIDKANAKIG